MGTAQVLRRVASEVERDQQEQDSLRAVIADLLAENARLRQALGETQEHNTALRNVRRRDLAEKKELQEKLKCVEHLREAANREAAIAKIAHAEAVHERRRAEANLVRVEGERDAVIEEVEAYAAIRISEAKDEARQCRDEIRVMARRERRQRRGRQRAERERDKALQQTQADADAIYTMRVAFDARPRD